MPETNEFINLAGEGLDDSGTLAPHEANSFITNVVCAVVESTDQIIHQIIQRNYGGWYGFFSTNLGAAKNVVTSVTSSISGADEQKRKLINDIALFEKETDACVLAIERAKELRNMLIFSIEQQSKEHSVSNESATNQPSRKIPFFNVSSTGSEIKTPAIKNIDIGNDPMAIEKPSSDINTQHNIELSLAELQRKKECLVKAKIAFDAEYKNILREIKDLRIAFESLLTEKEQQQSERRCSQELKR